VARSRTRTAPGLRPATASGAAARRTVAASLR
jgi:hypothetical protein